MLPFVQPTEQGGIFHNRSYSNSSADGPVVRPIRFACSDDGTPAIEGGTSFKYYLGSPPRSSLNGDNMICDELRPGCSWDCVRHQQSNRAVADKSVSHDHEDS